jgi:hypothetical protein
MRAIGFETASGFPMSVRIMAGIRQSAAGDDDSAPRDTAVSFWEFPDSRIRQGEIMASEAPTMLLPCLTETGYSAVELVLI